MNCCDQCGDIDRWTYELDGDGDGVEFLVETGHLIGGSRVISTVVFRAPNWHELA